MSGRQDDTFYYQSPQETLAHFEVDVKRGLTDAQVAKNREKHGKNELPPPERSSFLALILEQFEDKLVLILLGAAIISFVLAFFEEGEDRLTAFFEPLVIFVILILNATVGVVQETNAEAAIEKLRKSEASEAYAIRNGTLTKVAAADLVVGDIVRLRDGDKIPADCRMLEIASSVLRADESTLTGESVPVQKVTEAGDVEGAVNQDKRNVLFSGTLVVAGRCTAIVTRVGPETAFGQIAIHLQKKDDSKTPLEEKLDEFGDQLSIVISVICVVVWLININHFFDPVHGSAIKGAVYYFKIAVALAVAAIPEGLPAVVTTCLALGTMKMARKNAIVRSLPSVETLGCTTVICSDKTGTLTTNNMTVQRVAVIAPGARKVDFYSVSGETFAPVGQVYGPDGQVIVQPAVRVPVLAEIAKVSTLCNESTLLYTFDAKENKAKHDKTGEATEAALKVLAEKLGVSDAKEQSIIDAVVDPAARVNSVAGALEAKFEKTHLLEFTRQRKAMSVVVKARDGSNRTLLLVKGAPESLLASSKTVMDATGKVVPLSDGLRAELNSAYATLAADGLRCLGLAVLESPTLPARLSDDHYAGIEQNLTFLGMAGMLDPPRREVAESIAKCRTAGIRVIVITGDHPATATNICKRIGVFEADESTEGKVFLGKEFASMTEEAKQQVVKSAKLFARVEPQHKSDLVMLLRGQGEVVAMTGDGVNDAPALKAADIGVAMGSGTDVAREASKIVLQDDNFATIVMAVEEGRAIFANTKQFIRYLISSNIGEVACIFLTAAIGMPEALIPVQLLWVNLVTDGLPATALGFNPPDKDNMQRPPRSRDESIITRWMFFRYLAIGVYVGVGTVAGFVWWYLYSTNGPKITYEQLTHFHACAAKTGALFQDVDCSIFSDPRPSTVSLSVLVVIEMFNAFNAVSENQSLLVVTPFHNIWVVAACTLSMALHFMVIYVPFFTHIFHVAPLNWEEWQWVLILSAPVVVIDEALKFFSRQCACTKEKAE